MDSVASSPTERASDAHAIEQQLDQVASIQALRQRAADGLQGRQRVLLDIVSDEPALNIRELADRLGVHRTGAKHHVTTLRRRGHLVTLRQGRHVLHFTSWMPLPERRALAALRIGSVRSVVAAAFGTPGISASQLPGRLGLKPRTVRGTLRFLRHAGLVRMEKVPGTRGALVHLEQHTRIIWARWFDPARDRVGPAPLEEKPTKMAFLGLFFFSWVASANA